MAFTFDGAAKIVALSGTSVLDLRELYSGWKQWVQTADNAKYLPAFSVTGGDPIDEAAGTEIPGYFFLQNGWKVRPMAANHTLSVTNGILLVQGGGDPFVDPLGTYTVRILFQQPVQAITVATGGGGGSTPGQVADAVWAHSFVSKLLTVAKFLGLK